MKERNLCNEAGCSAACCRDSFFSGTYKEDKVREWFPDAIRVSSGSLHEQKAKGVYYYKGLYGGSRIRIVGTCPNLGENNNCQIYEDRPPDCANLEIGSKACNEFRERESKLIRTKDIRGLG